MNQSNRQNEIYALVQSGACTSVKELCAHVYASPATVRRDLRALEEQGLVRLMYGSVVPVADQGRDFPLALRANQDREVKRLLAARGAELIAADSTVMLDASSSTLYMADYISAEKNITVFTNSLKAAAKLGERGVTVYMFGGRLENQNFVTDGAWTEDAVGTVNVDYLFFSARAMDREGMITGPSERGVAMRRRMLSRARQRYFICTGEKIGKRATFFLASAADLTGVITDDMDLTIPNVELIRAGAPAGQL